MTTILPNFDPYIVLGVDKQSTPSEIKLAYRKLILKCHPDKIQDDALRAKASDEFQKVQESYEILTDDKRREQHDLAVRLAELRKKVNSQSLARAAANREYRDGYIYEERVPADAAFFTDSDEQRYTEEPPTYSKKYHDSAKRAHTKVAEEKKAKSVPLSSPRTPKQADREHVKSKNHDRAKHRTKERRRDVSDKYERTTSSFVYTGDDFSDSEDGSYYVKVTTEPRASPRESVPRRSKTEPHSSHRHRRHYIDSESEIEGEDYENDLNYAKEYITRSRDPIPEPERRYRSSRTHSSYDSPRYERESSRYFSRGYSRDEDIRHPASSPHRTSRRSHDRLSSPTRAYERSATTTSASPPKVSSSRAPPPVSRSSTAPHPRTRREGLSRSESNGMSTLTSMVAGIALESVIPSKTRSRAERNDSGYSSGPGTPEMTQGSSSAPKVSRFKIVEPSDREPETIIREPADARYRGTSPLPRSDRERSSRTKSSRSYVYDPVYDADIHTARPAAASKSSYSRSLYGEVRYSPDISIDGRRSSRRQAAY